LINKTAYSTRDLINQSTKHETLPIKPAETE